MRASSQKYRFRAINSWDVFSLRERFKERNSAVVRALSRCSFELRVRVTENRGFHCYSSERRRSAARTGRRKKTFVRRRAARATYANRFTFERREKSRTASVLSFNVLAIIHHPRAKSSEPERFTLQKVLISENRSPYMCKGITWRLGACRPSRRAWKYFFFCVVSFEFRDNTNNSAESESYELIKLEKE